MHGLVCGFGKGFSCGTIAVMDQVGGHHPDRQEEPGSKEVNNSSITESASHGQPPHRRVLLSWL